MRPVNIVHISDLHFSSKKAEDQAHVMRAFLIDLARARNTSEQPDLLIFSGDIVYDPDEADSFYNASDFIVAALHNIGLSEDRAIFVPGNHDASRAEIGGAPHGFGCL